MEEQFYLLFPLLYISLQKLCVPRFGQAWLLWRAADACARGMLQADACRKDPRECRAAQQSFGVS
jgi:peptidoglycan/LPS O-acetylase OafA/YrhL